MTSGSTPAREHRIAIRDHTLVFDCPTEVAFQRARWALEKEPDTILWIDEFEEGSRFWDIGANVGIYSIYAGVTRGCEVLACEPGAANFVGLNSNIQKNNLQERVKALCVAIDNAPRIDFLNMQSLEIGAALHSFGDNLDYKGERFTPSFRQGSLAVSIDMLCEVFGARIPAYVKIDVDGLEARVVSGGRRTFASPELKSVLVEVDLADTAEVALITDILEAAGLRRNENIPGKVRELGSARIYNLIFRRPT